MKTRTDDSPPLNPVQSWWLLGASVVALLPLTPHLPLWLSAIAAAALALRAWMLWSQQALLSRWVLVVAIIAGGIGVFIQYRTLFGQNSGVSLLMMFLALKQHEARARRDGVASVLLCYFLLLTTFFYSQAMPYAAALVLAVTVTTAALGSLTDSRLPPQRLLRNAGLMLAQATPFLLILFILFPRVSGPLWGLPRDAYSALSGLSDTMTPGAISQLSLSDAIAFRVRFATALPRRNQLYWRGPVLTVYDGYAWRPSGFSVGRRLPYAVDDNDIGYEVTLEPHNKPWLFALELPTEVPAEGVIASDYQLLAKVAISQRLRYVMRSQPDLAAGRDESRRVLSLATTLPPQGNPRIRAVAQRWRDAQADDVAILQQALAFFVARRLIYTLNPPLLGDDSVDEFLFDTHQGFCEHFASAFVFAMRAAGVPARVVTGYQGGEMNPVDGYLIVRQSDAHAWAEVWLAGKGWTRIDPTAESFPKRIEFNLAAAVPQGDPLPVLMRVDLSWLREFRYRWDAVANTWNQWILGYNPQRQHDFLVRLGMKAPDWKSMTASLAIFCGSVLGGLTVWALHQRRRIDPAQQLWLRATRRLARRGLARQAWEGPLDYAKRIAAARPDLAANISAIAQFYSGVRYGDAPRLDKLRAHVAAFKP